MAAGTSEEKGLLGFSSHRSHKRYGSTSVNMKKLEHVIRHKVSNQDTLQGIALRYGVSMELVKQHNKLWSSEAMFLHELLEVPVTKEVYEAWVTSQSCPPTPGAAGEGRVDGLPLETARSEGGALDNGLPPSSLSSPSSVTLHVNLHPPPSPVTSPPSPPVSPPCLDYSDTAPQDFLSKIDSNIAVMKSSIEKFDVHKYDVPAIDQMEVDDSQTNKVNKNNHRRGSQHRSDIQNGGFPVKNGYVISSRNSRFVNGSGRNGASGSNGVSSANGFGSCFAMSNGGYECDPDDRGGGIPGMGGSGVVDSPTAPPAVAVVGGNHVPREKVVSNGVPATGSRHSATRTITMSLKKLLRDQDDACQL